MVQWYLLKVAKNASGGMSCHGKLRCEISHNAHMDPFFLEIVKKIWQLVSILPTPKSFGTSSVVLVHRYDSCGYSFMAFHGAISRFKEPSAQRLWPFRH